ncbi:MAG TPA: hypothetical protein VEQ40_11685 [Pyrinomonadaceae bacterium]|nr:hypothetical protein [Pyrinomonadaceae bacterium]
MPSILQEPIAVDKANMMDTVIKDGYHKLEDVYKNLPKEQWPKATADGRGRPSVEGERIAQSNYALAMFGFLLAAFCFFKVR